MAKIAVESTQAVAWREAGGLPGGTTACLLARGEGWIVEDVLCTSGPRDQPFEERHEGVSIAMVMAGSFQYRSTTGSELMTPGTLLLGDPGQSFECAHEHGIGDRCIAFHFAPEFCERIAADAGSRPTFRIPRLPPLRALSPLMARACAGLAGSLDVSWEEIGVQLGARTVQLVGGVPHDPTSPSPAAVARITRAVRAIERHPDGAHTVASLAREARLSAYHFLRTFQRLTGVTPHQYVLRARLRAAAMRLAQGRARVLDVALDSGFGDVSNFNRAFRVEFGVSPRVYRRRAGGWPR